MCTLRQYQASYQVSTYAIMQKTVVHHNWEEILHQYFCNAWNNINIDRKSVLKIDTALIQNRYGLSLFDYCDTAYLCSSIAQVLQLVRCCARCKDRLFLLPTFPLGFQCITSIMF